MFKKILNILTTVLLIGLVVLLVVIIIARSSGSSLSIFGYRMYKVSSDSMVPTLNVGDVILVKKTAPEDIEKGDIITYMAQEGEMAGNPITHRVVAEPEEHNGTWVFLTQGDSEGAPLDPKITDSQLLGRYVRTLPIISKIYTPTGMIVLIILILILFGYELISMIVSYRKFDKAYDQYAEEVHEQIAADDAAEAGAQDEDAPAGTDDAPPDEK